MSFCICYGTSPRIKEPFNPYRLKRLSPKCYTSMKSLIYFIVLKETNIVH